MRLQRFRVITPLRVIAATGGAGFFVKSSALPNDIGKRKKGAEPVFML
jgi:hypothetical protein